MDIRVVVPTFLNQVCCFSLFIQLGLHTNEDFHKILIENSHFQSLNEIMSRAE